jgi:hypothetical protein
MDERGAQLACRQSIGRAMCAQLREMRVERGCNGTAEA